MLPHGHTVLSEKSLEKFIVYFCKDLFAPKLQLKITETRQQGLLGSCVFDYPVLHNVMYSFRTNNSFPTKPPNCKSSCQTRASSDDGEGNG